MHSLSARVVAAFALVALFVLVPATRLVAQDSKSSAIARELAQLMQAQKLESVAARSPSAPDQYVAVLYFPGQMLVVSAKYAAPALINEKLAGGHYRDIYLDLNSAAVANTKILITDLGADGLKAKRETNQAFDAQEAGGKTFQFDGNWREDKMSEDDYMKVFASADEAYVQALTILLGAVKKG